MSVGRFLIVSGTEIMIYDSSGEIMEGVNVVDMLDKPHDSELLGQGIIIRYVIQAIYNPINFNAFLLEG
jgi:hypothetical protein